LNPQEHLLTVHSVCRTGAVYAHQRATTPHSFPVSSKEEKFKADKKHNYKSKILPIRKKEAGSVESLSQVFALHLDRMPGRLSSASLQLKQLQKRCSNQIDYYSGSQGL